MEVSIETIMTIGGWLVGAGGAGGLQTWRLSRRKEKAEVQTAEVNMAQAVQDTYQQMLEGKDKEIQYYRADSSELRDRPLNWWQRTSIYVGGVAIWLVIMYGVVWFWRRFGRK